MNAAEYARHRGVTRQQVNKYIEGGKITARRVGSRWEIDPEQADRELSQRLAPDRGGKNGRQDDTMAPPAGGGPSFAQARTMREAYAAQIMKLEFLQKSGQLVDKNELRLKLAKLHMAVRDSLRTIPDRVTPVIASESDPTKIHALLLKEIGLALEGLQGLDWR